jgi:hypothetical protein
MSRTKAGRENIVYWSRGEMVRLHSFSDVLVIQSFFFPLYDKMHHLLQVCILVLKPLVSANHKRRRSLSGEKHQIH